MHLTEVMPRAASSDLAASLSKAVCSMSESYGAIQRGMIEVAAVA